MQIFFIIIGFEVGVLIGAQWREIWELRRAVKFLQNRVQPKAKPGVTPGAYLPPNETKQTPHVVTPKSPQRYEYDIHQQVLEENNLIERTLTPR